MTGERLAALVNTVRLQRCSSPTGTIKAPILIGYGWVDLYWQPHTDTWWCEPVGFIPPPDSRK